MVAQSALGGEPSMGDDRPRSIAEMPVQRPAAPATPAEARGRFFNTGNAFNVQLPPIGSSKCNDEVTICVEFEVTYPAVNGKPCRTCTIVRCFKFKRCPSCA